MIQRAAAQLPAITAQEQLAAVSAIQLGVGLGAASSERRSRIRALEAAAGVDERRRPADLSRLQAAGVTVERRGGDDG